MYCTVTLVRPASSAPLGLTFHPVTTMSLAMITVPLVYWAFTTMPAVLKVSPAL